jgi:hypothetical protein
MPALSLDRHAENALAATSTAQDLLVEAAYSDNNAAFFKGPLREPALSIGPKGVAPAHVGEEPQEGHFSWPDALRAFAGRLIFRTNTVFGTEGPNCSAKAHFRAMRHVRRGCAVASRALALSLPAFEH